MEGSKEHDSGVRADVLLASGMHNFTPAQVGHWIIEATQVLRAKPPSYALPPLYRLKSLCPDYQAWPPARSLVSDLWGSHMLCVPPLTHSWSKGCQWLPERFVGMQDLAVFQERTVQFLVHINHAVLQHVKHVAPWTLQFTPRLLSSYMQLFCNSVRLHMLARRVPQALIIQMHTLLTSLVQVHPACHADTAGSPAAVVQTVTTCTCLKASAWGSLYGGTVIY